MFSKILIANRGEIAVRVIRACKEMGIATVAVYSEADRDALHVSLPTRVSASARPPPAKVTLICAPSSPPPFLPARRPSIPATGCFRRTRASRAFCAECGIVFIGPSAEVIDRMGDKDEARRTMRAAGVPVVPGCDVVTTEEEALAAAREIGFPLLVKARSGGGGRGIRLVAQEDALVPAFLAATSEAASAFGDGAVYLEKFLSPVKHIEMQLLCDNFDGVVCLGERECSMQRKTRS